MSTLNDIQLLLDIQDKNLKFKENCIEKGTHKGKACTYVAATLTYTPTSCEVCHVSNDNYTVYKNGTQRSRITLPVTGVHPTYLVVKNSVLNASSVDLALPLRHQWFIDIVISR